MRGRGRRNVSFWLVCLSRKKETKRKRLLDEVGRPWSTTSTKKAIIVRDEPWRLGDQCVATRREPELIDAGTDHHSFFHERNPRRIDRGHSPWVYLIGCSAASDRAARLRPRPSPPARVRPQTARVPVPTPLPVLSAVRGHVRPGPTAGVWRVARCCLTRSGSRQQPRGQARVPAPYAD
jgi:hypothetical protein